MLLESENHSHGTQMTSTPSKQIAGARQDGFPDFGHNMLKYWKFRPGYLNFNHGSFGSPPTVVVEAMRQMVDQIEGFPDLFIRRTWLPLLNEVRGLLAKMIGARKEEVVIVTNVTHAINNIVNQIDWKDGDIIVCYSHTYGAIGQTLKHVCDRHPNVSLEVIDVVFPCPHSDIVNKTEKLLSRYNSTNGSQDGSPSQAKPSNPQRVRLLLTDSIASTPGVVLPWEDLVRLCHRYGVLSLIDGAHSIGQHAFNVKDADPDFFVSNCHKWLMSYRGGALMYVPLRNQALIRSPFPTSQFYESHRYPSKGAAKKEWSFERQFEWMGTIDWTPFFGITSAIQFRQSIGGEERIMRYCHELAVRGGKRLAERWRTEVMENNDLSQGELTAAMVTVRLPNVPEPIDHQEEVKIMQYFEESFFQANCFAAQHRHGNRWWIRLSVQVWNELQDFDRIATVIEDISDGIRRGAHDKVRITEELEGGG